MNAFNQDAIRWGNVEELLATLIETVDMGNRMFYRAHQKPGARSLPPLRVPRPRDRAKEKRQATTAEIIEALGVENIEVSGG